MASFNYTVDTQPMAEEIKSVSRHVNVTTGAVVAMQVAVIDAEARATDHICSNVNKGFYSLIRSQISQKVARLQSEVDSHLMQLNQQSKAVLGIKARMQRDYNMITARYVKLFTGINNNLKSRVNELDRPVMDFAGKQITVLNNRSRLLTATVPVTQSESVTESQKIIASNVKQKGTQAINSMRQFIHEMNVQKVLTDKILITNTGNISDGTIYMPIVLLENNHDSSAHKNIEIKMPAVQLDNATKTAITNMIYNQFDGLAWSYTNPDSMVSNEFNKLLQNSGKGERVKVMAQWLYQSRQFQTI